MIIQQIINGLSLGIVYALVAVGYTLVFGVLNVVNMAHGDIFMVSSYVILLVFLVWKGNMLAAMFIAVIASGVLGMILDRLAIRPVIKKSFVFGPLISTIGVSVVLQNIIVRLMTADQQRFPSIVPFRLYEIGDVSVTSTQVLNLGLALALTFGLLLYIDHTKIGKAIKAVSENPMVASIFGINVSYVMFVTVSVASALGGIAGLLIGNTFNAVDPYMGLHFGLKGLICLIVAGGMSIIGAMATGIILGVSEVISVAYISASWRDAIAFFLLVLVLLVKPSGLFAAKS